MKHPKQVNAQMTESRLVVARGWGKGGMVSDCLMAIGFPLGVMKKFWMIVIVAQHCECI